MVPNRYSDEYYAQALNQLNTSHDKSLQRLSNPEFNKINSYSPSISMGDVVNGFTDYLMNGLKGITADIPYAIERKFP